MNFNFTIEQSVPIIYLFIKNNFHEVLSFHFHIFSLISFLILFSLILIFLEHFSVHFPIFCLSFLIFHENFLIIWAKKDFLQIFLSFFHVPPQIFTFLIIFILIILLNSIILTHIFFQFHFLFLFNLLIFLLIHQSLPYLLSINLKDEQLNLIFLYQLYFWMVVVLIYFQIIKCLF